MDYYKEQQKQFNKGENLYLGDPIEVSYDFIINNLGQILVDKDDLVIIDPATVEDFMKTPISYYIGYISKSSYDNLIRIDKVEYLGTRDEERMKELNINPDSLPNGFYIHNPNSYPDSLSLSEKTEYKILNWKDLSNHKSITKEEFMKFLEGENPYNSSENLLFHVYTKDGYVTELIEQHIP
jgi:hypothetical protein